MNLPYLNPVFSFAGTVTHKYPAHSRLDQGAAGVAGKHISHSNAANTGLDRALCHSRTSGVVPAYTAQHQRSVQHQVLQPRNLNIDMACALPQHPPPHSTSMHIKLHMHQQQPPVLPSPQTHLRCDLSCVPVRASQEYKAALTHIATAQPSSNVHTAMQTKHAPMQQHAHVSHELHQSRMTSADLSVRAPEARSKAPPLQRGLSQWGLPSRVVQVSTM